MRGLLPTKTILFSPFCSFPGLRSKVLFSSAMFTYYSFDFSASSAFINLAMYPAILFLMDFEGIVSFNSFLLFSKSEEKTFSLLSNFFVALLTIVDFILPIVYDLEIRFLKVTKLFLKLDS